MERDEVYVPKTRKDLGIPDKPHDQIDWDEIFGDTPIYTLYMLICQQLLAFPAYLRELLDWLVDYKYDLHSTVFNVSGQKTYPKWTNHFDRKDFLASLLWTATETEVNLANSILFTKAQRNAVIISNVGIAVMALGVIYAASVYGVANVIKYYGFPWLEVSHWCKHI